MSETGWSDISVDDFYRIARRAEQNGGATDVNARGSVFVYFGTNELNGEKFPRCIAVKHPHAADGVTQKCRANMVVIGEMK